MRERGGWGDDRRKCSESGTSRCVSDWLNVESYQEQFKRRAHKRILGPVENVLAQQYEKKQRLRDEDHLHPSQLAKNNWCPRANVYSLMKHPESNSRKLSFKQYNIFRTGDDIHSKWQKWMWEAGGLSGNWYCTNCGHGWMAVSPMECPECGIDTKSIRYREVPVYDEQHRILGHSDGIWEDADGRAVVELKSVGVGTIRWDAPRLYKGYEDGELSLDQLWDKIKRPLLPHRRQVNLYMHCLKIDNAVVIYEWKPTQDVREFHLTYDPDLVRPMLEGSKQVIRALDNGIVPDRPEGFRKSIECRFCEFKDTCWS